VSHPARETQKYRASQEGAETQGYEASHSYKGIQLVIAGQNTLETHDREAFSMGGSGLPF